MDLSPASFGGAAGVDEHAPLMPDRHGGRVVVDPAEIVLGVPPALGDERHLLGHQSPALRIVPEAPRSLPERLLAFPATVAANDATSASWGSLRQAEPLRQRASSGRGVTSTTIAGVR